MAKKKNKAKKKPSKLKMFIKGRRHKMSRKAHFQQKELSRIAKQERTARTKTIEQQLKEAGISSGKTAAMRGTLKKKKRSKKK